jgi:hypothetical protein
VGYNFHTLNAKPITLDGTVYPSITAFARKFGLHPNAVTERLKRGVTGKDLAAKSLVRRRAGS